MAVTKIIFTYLANDGTIKSFDECNENQPTDISVVLLIERCCESYWHAPRGASRFEDYRHPHYEEIVKGAKQIVKDHGITHAAEFGAVSSTSRAEDLNKN